MEPLYIYLRTSVPIANACVMSCDTMGAPVRPRKILAKRIVTKLMNPQWLIMGTISHGVNTIPLIVIVIFQKFTISCVVRILLARSRGDNLSDRLVNRNVGKLLSRRPIRSCDFVIYSAEKEMINISTCRNVEPFATAAVNNFRSIYY